jgi:hypothetical protein
MQAAMVEGSAVVGYSVRYTRDREGGRRGIEDI